jgi:hypothetical protein
VKNLYIVMPAYKPIGILSRRIVGNRDCLASRLLSPGSKLQLDPLKDIYIDFDQYAEFAFPSTFPFR